MQWWGAGLVLLYCVQCAVGFWVQRIPASNRTGLHRMLLAGLGACIVLLALYDALLGFIAAGDDPLKWGILFVVSNKRNFFRKLPFSKQKLIHGRFLDDLCAVSPWCPDDTASIRVGAGGRKGRVCGFGHPRSERGS